MKLTKLPLVKWQELIDEFNSSVKHESPCAFRVDGSQFSVGIFFGGFDFDGVRFTVVGAAEDGAYIALHPKFRGWLIKRKEPKKKKQTPKGKQLALDIGGTDK